jgi:3-phosphoshikimate 1-carboxyvinyltransferase
MEDIPDTVLTMAVVAAFAKSPTRVTNIANLRVKECDRISAAVTELRRIGVEAEEGADWLRVVPGQSFKPAEIETYDDHRVAMAFSLAGLIVDGIHIKDPDCVAKSFPTYWEVYDALRQNFHAHDAHEKDAVVTS